MLGKLQTDFFNIVKQVENFILIKNKTHSGFSGNFSFLFDIRIIDLLDIDFYFLILKANILETFVFYQYNNMTLSNFSKRFATLNSLDSIITYFGCITTKEYIM